MFSTDPAPVVSYPAPGQYSVTLVAVNAQSADTLTVASAVTVSEGVEPFYENFTGGPDNDWEIDDYNSDFTSWTVSNQLGCHGQALYIDNYFNDTRNQRDFLRTRLDLRDLSQVAFHFDVAYAPHSNAFFDGLRVNVIDCAGEKSIVYHKAGELLATAPATGNNAFTPSGCEQWRHEVVDLSAFDGQIITLEIEAAGGYGNRLYIDNVDFSSPDLANLGPVVFLTSPADGAFYQDELPTFPLAATAGDVDGLVTAVRFYVNDELYATDSVAPYTVDFTAPIFGVYTFRAEAVDNDGATGQSALATVVVEETVATTHTAADWKLLVYPNPAGDRLWVQFTAPGSEEVYCRLTDLLGRTVRLEKWAGAGHRQSRTLQLSGLPAGIYHLVLQQGDRPATKRVVVSGRR